MTRRRILFSTLRFLFAFGGTGCGNPDQPATSEPPTSTIRVLAVHVSPQLVQLLAIGETRQLTARIAPLNATDQTISWETSDSTVVTVDGTGLVTARGAGGVFVTAVTRDGRHEASANVRVLPESGQ